MTIYGVDHTAIAVANLDEAIGRFERLYGITASERARISDQHVEVAFLRLGATALELVMPLDPTSGVARFLTKRGEGLHHVGLAVDDVKRELESLSRQGAELIDREPRPGLHGLIAFVHPRATGGVLVELVQHTVDEMVPDQHMPPY